MAAKAIKLDAKLASDITTGALANGTTKIGFVRKLIQEKNEVQQLKKELMALKEKFKKEDNRSLQTQSIDDEKLEQIYWMLRVLFASEKFKKEESFQTVFNVLNSKLPQEIKK